MRTDLYTSAKRSGFTWTALIAGAADSTGQVVVPGLQGEAGQGVMSRCKAGRWDEWSEHISGLTKGQQLRIAICLCNGTARLEII